MLKLRASNCWLQEKLTLTARPSGAEHSALTTQLVLELQGCYHDPPTRRVDNFTKGFMVSSGCAHMYEHYLLLGFQTYGRRNVALAGAKVIIRALAICMYP